MNAESAQQSVLIYVHHILKYNQDLNDPFLIYDKSLLRIYLFTLVNGQSGFFTHWNNQVKANKQKQQQKTLLHKCLFVLFKINVHY